MDITQIERKKERKKEIKKERRKAMLGNVE